MKKISLVSSCFNEEDNIFPLYEAVKEQFDKLGNGYEFEHIIINNGSLDNTEQKLRELAKKDKRVKIILNSRNFGHIRSPFYGIIQATGDAVIYLASDLQDPPSVIPQLVKSWEDGYKVVLAIKKSSQENPLIFFIRKLYYDFLKMLSDDDTTTIKNFTGFGLYDKKIIDIVRTYDDPYPYFRGLISEIGFEKSFVEFHQPTRKNGKTKNNLYSLYDNAMIGVVKHSKVPLRMMTFLGFTISFLSLVVALGYLVAKLIFWERFEFGLAPLIISLFFFSSVQLFFMGILGEYIGAIHTRVNKKPLVIEKERINF